MTGLHVRSIDEGELEAFSQTSQNPDFNQRFKERLQAAIKRGETALNQCFVLEEGDQWRGRLLFNGSGELSLGHFEVPWWEEEQQAQRARMLLQQGLDLVRQQGAVRFEAGMATDVPNWEKRQAAYQACGMAVFRERVGYHWEAPKPPVVVPDRLQFKPLEEVGRSVFVQAIRRAWASSLDMDDQAHKGADKSNQDQLNSARAGFAYGRRDYLARPGWWQLAYCGGALVGLLQPVLFRDGAGQGTDNGTIFYIAVLPEHRGRGYINDLLAQSTALLQLGGVGRISADTDGPNIPMQRAFERGGWERHEQSWMYRVELGG
ncbi:MAG: GNAT family N-acetyltransferase [Candidatus Latescibacteria bacterium]|nr:GNAT family N-acetyltransferase [Candidatus Latescibacterota bacterium]